MSRRVMRVMMGTVSTVLLAGLMAIADDKATPAAQPTGSEVAFTNQIQLGNIFTAGEKVEILAAVATGTNVEWVVNDFTGRKVDSGTAAVINQQVTIAPKSAGNGYYSVFLTSKIGQTVKGEGRTSYAVVAPVDITQMADAQFGVNTHFAQSMSSEIIPLLAKAGLAHVREGMNWNKAEKVPGKIDFSPDHFTDAMASLQKHHIASLVNVLYGNTNYFDDPAIPAFAAAPHTDEQREAYSRFCLETLKQFGPQIEAMVIWEDYNGGFCKGPADQDRPKFYTEMLKDSYTAIKAKYPKAHVVGGAMVGIPLPYAEQLFQHDALKYLDGVAVESMNYSAEIVDQRLGGLVELMKKYNGGAAKPIWNHEITCWSDKSPDRGEAARSLVETLVASLAHLEVEHVSWYLACDLPPNATNMGLMHGEKDPSGKFTPTMGYVAYANLIQQLHHAKPVCRESTDPRTRVYRFERAGQTIWVCWSASEAAQLTFSASQPLKEVDFVGGEKSLTPEKGKITVTATETPVYVIANNKETVTAVAEVPRQTELLADSVSDFFDEQGKAGWSYLSYISNADGLAVYAPDKAEILTSATTPGGWERFWKDPQGGTPNISQGNTHPASVKDNQVWTVRRWTSNHSGPIHIVGKASRTNKNGDGVGVKVLLDGKELFNKLLPPASETEIDLSSTVKKGSRVDFVVTPGPGLDTNSDSTGFHVAILTQPE